MAETERNILSEKDEVISYSTLEIPKIENSEKEAFLPAILTTTSQEDTTAPVRNHDSQLRPGGLCLHVVEELKPGQSEPEVKMINIAIQIKVPGNFKLPSFRRPKRRRLVLVFVLTVLYLSFIACSAAAWGLRNTHPIMHIHHAPLIMGTFTPFLDAFAMAYTISKIRKYKHSDTPGASHLVLFFLQLGLTIIHIICLVSAINWMDQQYLSVYENRSAYRYMSSYIYYIRGTIPRLLIYPMATMIVMKILLGIWVFKDRGMSRIIKDSFNRLISITKEEFEWVYCNDDACGKQGEHVHSIKAAAEGKIYLA